MTPIITLIFWFGVGTVQSKVELKTRRIDRIAFKGEELMILVDNSLGKADLFTICFASLPDASSLFCPSGFAELSTSIAGNTKRKFILNRKGQLLLEGVNLGMLETVKFNEDKSINVTVGGLSESKLIVTLLNAEIYELEKPDEDKTVTKAKSTVSVKAIAVVVLLMLVFVILGILLWICVIRKPEPNQFPDMNYPDSSSQSHRKSPTPRHQKSRRSINATTTTTMQNIVSPNQITHPSSATKAQSKTTMAKPSTPVFNVPRI